MKKILRSVCTITMVLLLAACKKDMMFKVSPSTAKVGEQVCISLDNKSTANDFVVDWGDGSKTPEQDNVGSTFGVCHTYTKTGTYTIKASAKNYNEGTASITINP